MENLEAPTPQADLIRSRFPDSITAVSEDSAGLRVEVIPENVYDVCLFLRDKMEFDYPANHCAMDTGESFLLWYHLYSVARKTSATVKVEMDRENPVVSSVTEIWPGMNWHERESFDMYGIRFRGHPDEGSDERMRILLPEDWEGFPFRKDYEPVFSGDPTHGPQETN
jgi:NADH-quinone oxidoreductase subunit C